MLSFFMSSRTHARTASTWLTELFPSLKVLSSLTDSCHIKPQCDGSMVVWLGNSIAEGFCESNCEGAWAGGIATIACQSVRGGSRGIGLSVAIARNNNVKGQSAVISRGKLPSACVLRYTDIAVKQPCDFSTGNEESLHDVAVQSDKWYP